MRTSIENPAFVPLGVKFERLLPLRVYGKTQAIQRPCPQISQATCVVSGANYKLSQPRFSVSGMKVAMCSPWLHYEDTELS